MEFDLDLIKITFILKPQVMKNIILLFTLILSVGYINGQSVVSSGGQSGTSNDLHASATVGEAIIGARTEGSLFSNQGFQQPLQSDITSVVEINSKLKVELSIGPIPTYGLITISIDKSIDGNFLLVDNLGRVLKKLTLKKNQLTFIMDLSQLEGGVYYLTIDSTESKQLTAVPIVKI